MNIDYYMMSNNIGRALYQWTIFQSLAYLPDVQDLPIGKHERKRLKQLEIRAMRSIGLGGNDA